MKTHLYKMTCWEQNKKWHVNDVTNLSGLSAKWYTPLRILGLTIDDYIDLLLNKFHAKGLHYYEQTDYLGFHFLKEYDAKAFCSYVNKEARSKQYYCE